MQQLYQSLERDRALMVEASRELKSRGLALAKAEADYQTIKAQRVLQLKADGMNATLIGMIIKGDQMVNIKMFERDSAKVLYDSAQEALNCYKLDARLLEAQIAREWNEAKDM